MGLLFICGRTRESHRTSYIRTGRKEEMVSSHTMILEKVRDIFARKQRNRFPRKRLPQQHGCRFLVFRNRLVRRSSSSDSKIELLQVPENKKKKKKLFLYLRSFVRKTLPIGQINFPHVYTWHNQTTFS